MSQVDFIRYDGGREAAGFRGSCGDCVVRSVAIATGRRYRDVYDLFSAYGRSERACRGRPHHRSAREGVNTKRAWFISWMEREGFRWHGQWLANPIKLDAEELRTGRLVVSLTDHYTAMLNGVIFDAYDPRTEHAYPRTVFGFWSYHGPLGPCAVDTALIEGKP